MSFGGKGKTLIGTFLSAAACKMVSMFPFGLTSTARIVEDKAATIRSRSTNRWDAGGGSPGANDDRNRVRSK